MKRIISLWLAGLCAVSALTLLAQSPPPDLKLQVLTERPVSGQLAKIMVFYTTSSAMAAKDSINLPKRQIIHFQSQPILIDNILDTISILADYLDKGDLILDAYRWPGHPVWLVDNHSECYGRWLGFYSKKVMWTDTLKLIYQTPSNPTTWQIKLVETSRKRSIEINDHPNYWLIGAWGILLGFIAIAIIFWKIVNRILSYPERATNWENIALFLAIMIWAFAALRIIFSGSILILLALIVATVAIAIKLDKRKRSNHLKS